MRPSHGLSVCRPEQADDLASQRFSTLLSQQQAMDDDLARKGAQWSKPLNGPEELCG